MISDDFPIAPRQSSLEPIASYQRSRACENIFGNHPLCSARWSGWFCEAAGLVLGFTYRPCTLAKGSALSPGGTSGARNFSPVLQTPGYYVATSMATSRASPRLPPPPPSPLPRPPPQPRNAQAQRLQRLSGFSPPSHPARICRSQRVHRQRLPLLLPG